MYTASGTPVGNFASINGRGAVSSQSLVQVQAQQTAKQFAGLEPWDSVSLPTT